jgi:hypothetical protein
MRRHILDQRHRPRMLALPRRRLRIAPRQPPK